MLTNVWSNHHSSCNDKLNSLEEKNAYPVLISNSESDKSYHLTRNNKSPQSKLCLQSSFKQAWI